jgi:hypothetical protein
MLSVDVEIVQVDALADAFHAIVHSPREFIPSTTTVTGPVGVTVGPLPVTLTVKTTAWLMVEGLGAALIVVVVALEVSDIFKLPKLER